MKRPLIDPRTGKIHRDGAHRNSMVIPKSLPMPAILLPVPPLSSPLIEDLNSPEPEPAITPPKKKSRKSR